MLDYWRPLAVKNKINILILLGHKDDVLNYVFDNYDNMGNAGLLKKDSKYISKIGRWMLQNKNIYLVNAKSLGIRYYSAMNAINNQLLNQGLKPDLNIA